MLDKIDKITSILSSLATILASLTVIIGSIWVACSFKYKHDAEVRKMLIENYKKFEPIAKEILANAKAPFEKVKDLWEILDEAELCFHRELVNFIKNFKSKYIKLHVIQQKMDSPQSEYDRLTKIDEEFKLLIEFREDLKKLKNISTNCSLKQFAQQVKPL